MTTFPKSKIVRFPDYNILVLENGDYISKVVLSGKDWAAETSGITALFVDGVETPLVLDIGANLGTYAIKTGRSLVARGGDVVAFEPQRLVFYHLCTSIVLNRLMNVHAMNFALGDRDGMVEVPTSFDGRNCNYGAVSLDPGINDQRGWNIARDASGFSVVPLRKLDDVPLPRKIDFIKMDVEGFEKKVLDGAGGTLEESGWPPMILEVWQGRKFADIREELLRKIDALGYGTILLKTGECIAQHPKHGVKVAFVQTPDGPSTLVREQ